ncbi:hypothetical protein GQ54DRAFT_301467 [Martensiomyces pterosporus]|nr:hypothetical protein GQ54DRAFT_301467 [Martensiomyces pterosporus]
MAASSPAVCFAALASMSLSSLPPDDSWASEPSSPRIACACSWMSVCASPTAVPLELMVQRCAVCSKHVRHVLDHFNLLFAAALPPQTGTESAATREPRCEPVHYSHRVRNVSTEKDVASGMSSIEAAVERALDLQLRSPGLLEPIQVFDTLPNGKEAGFTSTLGRELWFCIHHLVHHNAVIASLMHEFGLDRPADFAYAPSTIHAQEAAKN